MQKIDKKRLKNDKNNTQKYRIQIKLKITNC